MKTPVVVGIGVLWLVTLGCSKEPAPAAPSAEAAPLASERLGTVVDDAAMADEAAGANWLAFGRTYSEQRFSPLDQVNAANVASLGVDWYMDLPNARGLVSTPLVVDGVMYFVESMNRIRAVDASSGEELWMWDPKVHEHSDMRVGWEHNRGIGIWKDKVYQATWDGRLIAIDRATGKPVWSERIYDQGMPLYNTGAPKIFKGKVMIGSGGTEAGPNRGYVVAHDAETGEFLWKFYIVPGNPADGFENEAMKMAAKTWTGEWWKYGGGGNAWHGFTYDLDVVYIGTGNGAPWNQKVRSPGGGDNLFLDSIVALDPDTGEYLWHYQNTPGETWDYNSNMDIILADLEIDGETVKAMMQAPKNGFFYVHDRENRKLVSAETYAEINWATHVDMETGRPVLQISAIYNDEGIDPDSWQSAVFEGDTTAVGWRIVEDRTHLAGSLQARDPVTNTVAWEVPMYGIGNAGTMTTAGNLVFQGRVDGTLRAYDATTGEELWSHDLGLGITAPPVTYSVDGKQYVALLVGWGGGVAGLGGDISTANGWAYGVHERRLVAFSLDGDAALPPQPPAAEAQPIEMLQFEIDDAMADQGAYEYGVRCTVCHGFNAIGAGMAPDLRGSPILASADAFADVVRNGSRQVNGMPVYEHLSDDQLLAIRHYVRREAEKALPE
jgi:quinohemoprotein ethanol dehydrogenase